MQCLPRLRVDSGALAFALIIGLATAQPAAFAQGNIVNGQNHTGSISAAGQTVTWTFTANAGDAISVSIGEVTDTNSLFWPWIRLQSPNATQLGSGYGALSGHINVASAPLTGTYTVLVASADSGRKGTGTYRLTLAKTPGAFVVPAGDDGGPMTNGENHIGAIHLADLDLWTFQANAGDAISLSIGEVTDTGSFWPWIRLRSPTGAQLGSGYGALSGHIDIGSAPLTGTYTVLVASADSGSNGTGTYRLTLAKTPGAFVVPSGDEGGEMTNGANHTGAIPLADLDMWTFQANAGDAISVSIGELTDTGSFWPWIRLRSPTGAQLGSGYGALSGHINLASAPLTGTYTVLVASADSGSNGTGTYRLTLAKTPGAFVVPSGDEGGAMTNGANHTGAIHLADLDQWTFQANAGDAISLGIGEVTDTGSFWPWIRLRSPTGVQLGSGYGALSGHIDIASAPLTGTYTVLVASADSGSNGTGTYRLTLAKSPGGFVVPSGDEGGAMTNGANHTGAIQLADLDQWTFQANAGDAISVSIGEVTDTGSFWPWIRLRSPTGVQLGSGYGALSGHINVASAPQTGTYTVVVASADSGSNGTGTYRLTLAKTPGAFIVPSGDEGGALTVGPNNPGTIHLADLDQWTLKANAGDTITVSISETVDTGSFWPWIRLRGPTGVQYGSSYGATGGLINIASAPLTGTYTVVVASADSGSNGTGSYLINSSHSGSSVQPPISNKLLGPDCPGTVLCGNPINITTGNKYEEVTDYETAGPNRLGFTRYYNSLADLGASPSILGKAWRSKYDRTLYFITPTSLIAERATGQTLTFTLNGGAWKPDSDVDLRLTQTGSGVGSTWTLVDREDTVETYSATAPDIAMLTTIRSRNGYTSTLSRNADGTIQAVTDSFGRTLQFSYQNGRLSALSTPDNLTLTYSYTAPSGTPDRLTSVGYSTTPATNQTYVYENASFPYALTGIVDETGKRYATWAYDASGRANLSQHAGGVDRVLVAYNANGTRTVTNALGQREIYTFAVQQGVAKVTRVDRLVTATTAAANRQFSYDANGYLASETDWNGIPTTYVNDARGLPLTIVEAAGTPPQRMTTIAYDPQFHVPTQVVAPGITTDLVYDASGNVLTRTLTDTTTTTVPYATNGTKRIWTYTWDPNGLLTSIKGPRTALNQLTTFTYDGTGTLIRTTNALGQQVQVTQHTGGGRPLTVVDANGVATEMTYDDRLRLKTSTVTLAAGPRTTTYTYDAAGNLIRLTQPDGSFLTNTYDAAHRLIATTDRFNQVVDYTLNAVGNRILTEVKNASNVTTWTGSAVFDALGRKIQETGGAGQLTRTTHDNNGNVLTVTDPLTRITHRAYDARNRLFRVTDPAGGIATTGFDSDNRPVRVTDPNGAVTTYVYDGFGDLIQVHGPDTGTTVYRYDLGGNLVQKVDARNVVENHTYDALDRRTSTKYPAGAPANVTYRYDEAGHSFGIGRLTSTVDEAGTLSFSYDKRGSLLSQTRTHGAATLATSYGYDAANRVSSITYPSGAVAGFVRDLMGRISGVTIKPSGAASPLAVASNVTYQPFGPVASFTFGNGISASRTFDLDYRMTSLTEGSVQNLTYGYNAVDTVQTIGDAVSSANNQTFGYDVLDRLTSAGGVYGNFVYSYDSAGNRLTQVAAGIASTYTYTPQSNRLTQIQTGGASQALTYTPSGSIKTITFVPSSQPVIGLGYNVAGRLSLVTTGGQPTLAYAYDAFGHRLVKTGVGNATTLYQYDQDGRLLESATGAAITDYLYLGDQPIATLTPGANALAFIHSDRLGTPQRVTNAAQTVVWRANYEPFGAVHASSSQTTAATQDLRFPGQEFEFETGWHQNWFRDYSPALGRYLESDPIGLSGGLNTYAYANSDPIGRTDRQGLIETIYPATPIDWFINWGWLKIVNRASPQPYNCLTSCFGPPRAQDQTSIGPNWRNTVDDVYERVGGMSVMEQNVRSGDVALVSDAQGYPVHCALVLQVSNGKTTLLFSKLGDGEGVLHSLDELPQLYQGTIRYLRDPIARKITEESFGRFLE